MNLDLDAYLDRIGCTRPAAPSLDGLASLLEAHTRAIPFENFDVLLGLPIRLDLPSLQGKLVKERRGGYCFEHATLFASVLEALGFSVGRHTARVVLFVPADRSARTHMFLTVPVNGRTFVVDPGFGTLAPRVPVPLDGAEAQGVHGETHRLVHTRGRVALHARAGGEETACWVATLDDDVDIDVEVGNHYTSTHPDSGFVNRLMLRALTPRGRVTVMNRDAAIVEDGERRALFLEDRSALRELVNAYFGFDLPALLHLRVPAIPEWT